MISDDAKAGEDSLLGFTAAFFLIATIYYIPISGIPDIVKSLTSNVPVVRGGLHSHFYLLLMRDILAVVCQLLGFAYFLKINARLPKIQFGFVFAIILLFAFGYKMFHDPPVAIAGLKTFEYLGVFFLFYFFFSERDDFPKLVDYALFFVVLVELILVLLQTRYMQAYEGKTFFGSRTIGTFNNPNTLGAVCCILAFYFLFLAKSSLLLRITLGLILTFICFTSGSRVSIFTISIVIAISLLSFVRGYARWLMFVGAFVALSFLISKINIFAGRTSMPSLFQDSRWSIFVDTFQGQNIFTFLFGDGLGNRANIIFALATQLPHLFVIPDDWTLAESTLVAITSQIGVIGLIFFYAMILSILWQAGFVGFLLFVLICLIGFSNSWLDLYPFNLFVAMCMGKVVSDRASESACKVASQL